MKKVKKLWFTDDRICIETDNNTVQSQLLRFFPRLQAANDSQRADWNESYFGLHWDSVDEDISFDSFAWSDNDPLRYWLNDSALSVYSIPCRDVARRVSTYDKKEAF